MTEDVCTVHLKIKNLISVPAKFYDVAKREVYNRIKDNLMVWDPQVGGVMLKFSQVKLEKRLVEIVEEQDYVTIPVNYTAVYFIPRVNGVTYAEVVDITGNVVRLNVLALFEGTMYLENSSDIKPGERIKVQIVQHFVRTGEQLVLDCQMVNK